ncbi:SDR family oxidoreductase [Microbacterium sp. ASV49]|uniref:SDR family oxidoreductase n=1 Tax=Microbacterium candidum TaxID=3041922 RepID=A0ABT7MVF1_9MICO|nr:SDR family oxidoreductase [Microbacterium sp. ASV49]MDL9978431.1 SDR family oxidoreductase [Microbacterium sp. ASV49]
MIDFAGKVALVTGAGRGIGRATALALADSGARLVVTDVRAQVEGLTYETAGASELDATVDLIRDAGGEAIAAHADVRDVAELRAAVDRALAEWGRLDTVVANAGIASWPPTTWEATEEQWGTMLDVVLTGTWNTVRAAVPALRAGGRGGAIIIVGSTAAVRPLATIGHYAAAKSGLVGMAKSLALELAPESIRVVVVEPGGTSTYMTENPQAEKWQAGFGGGDTLALPMPIERMEPIDVAHAIRWLASDEARYITGTTLVVDAGATL